MKSKLHNFLNWSVILILISMPFCLLGNPVVFDPEREISHISFLVVATVCFTVEVVIIASFFKLFHDVNKNPLLIVALYLLNLLAFSLVLIPLQKLTKSILIAELGVVLIEMIGIRLCITLSGADATWRRSLLYASISNTFSILISLGLKT